MLKIRGFWGVTVLAVVKFLKFLPGQNVKALRSFETSGLFTETKERHVTEELILQTFCAFRKFFFYFTFKKQQNVNIFSIKPFKFGIFKT
jgi:hypothetical protein